MESIPNNESPILVVDDDVGLLSSIKATLVSSGMPEPALVSDSRRVMELVREHHFMVVFLDLIMPHINGMEVLQQIKEEFHTIYMRHDKIQEDYHASYKWYGGPSTD